MKWFKSREEKVILLWCLLSWLTKSIWILRRKQGNLYNFHYFLNLPLFCLTPLRFLLGIGTEWQRWECQTNLSWTQSDGQGATTVHSASKCVVWCLSNEGHQHFPRWVGARSPTKECWESFLPCGMHLRSCLSVSGLWVGKTIRACLTLSRQSVCGHSPHIARLNRSPVLFCYNHGKFAPSVGFPEICSSLLDFECLSIYIIHNKMQT